MFVANRMAKNPVTVSPDTPVDEAASAMKKGHFRRLPVVEDGKLVGFLTDKDIMRVAPAPATTLLNGPLSKRCKKDKGRRGVLEGTSVFAAFSMTRGGTHSSTKPMRLARCASIVFPVSIISSAA